MTVDMCKGVLWFGYLMEHHFACWPSGMDRICDRFYHVRVSNFSRDTAVKLFEFQVDSALGRLLHNLDCWDDEGLKRPLIQSKAQTEKRRAKEASEMKRNRLKCFGRNLNTISCLPGPIATP